MTGAEREQTGASRDDALLTYLGTRVGIEPTAATGKRRKLLRAPTTEPDRITDQRGGDRSRSRERKTMHHLFTITAVKLGWNTIVRIPESWDVFTFNGFLYRRDDAGRVVIDRAYDKRSA